MTRNLEKFKEVYLQELRKVHTLGTTEEKRLFYGQNCRGINVAASHVLSKTEYAEFAYWVDEIAMEMLNSE